LKHLVGIGKYFSLSIPFGFLNFKRPNCADGFELQFALDKFPALVEAHDPHGCTELFARMRKQLQHSLQTCAGAKPTDHTKTAGDEVRHSTPLHSKSERPQSRQ
jgi:hypothetical protein